MTCRFVVPEWTGITATKGSASVENSVWYRREPIPQLAKIASATSEMGRDVLPYLKSDFWQDLELKMLHCRAITDYVYTRDSPAADLKSLGSGQ